MSDTKTMIDLSALPDIDLNIGAGIGARLAACGGGHVWRR